MSFSWLSKKAINSRWGKIVGGLRKIELFFRRLWFRIVGFFFWLIRFDHNEYVTLRIALSSKRKKSMLWYGNNLFIPLLVIYSPYIWTLISNDFESIKFSKSIILLSLTGGLTLMGINVMRVSLSLVNEKIDETRIPEHLRKLVSEDI